MAEVASRARFQEKEASPSEEGTPLSDPQVDRVWDALHGIREALVKELPGVVAALASESSVGQVRDELKRMKTDLGLVRDLLKRFEGEKWGGGKSARVRSRKGRCRSQWDYDYPEHPGPDLSAHRKRRASY